MFLNLSQDPNHTTPKTTTTLSTGKFNDQNVKLFHFPHITLGLMPFFIIINVFIYVGSICNTWILLKAESRCPDICCTHAQKLDFDGCKAHCKKHGAKRLTYFPWNYCLCCLDSSEIVPDTSGGKGVNVYECIENAGNCIYFPN